MQTHRAHQTKNWWVKGDTSVQGDSRITFLVDAHATLLTMCRHFLKATSYIYIAAWGMTPTMRMVRGMDQRAGPDGSHEQEELRVGASRRKGWEKPKSISGVPTS